MSGNSKRAGSDAAEKRDAADEAGASDQASPLIRVFCGPLKKEIGAMRVRRCAPLMVCGLVLVVGSTRELRAAPPVSLDDKVITANRELDRRLLEAHERKDAAMVESLFANSPDAFFIGPGGMLHKGRDAIRESFAQFFASLDTIRGEIQDISYLPAGDGVIAVGTVVYHRKPRNGPPDERTVVWTDFRRKEGDKWVYLFRHAHWPMAANNLAFVPK